MNLPDFKNLIIKIKKNFRGNPLKLTAFCGLILVFVLAWILLFSLVFRDGGIFPEKSGENFYRDLEKYDAALGFEEPLDLEKRLDKLEKTAKGQDDWLSVLKRRRNLAYKDSVYLKGYQNSALEAVKTFPFSEVMAAVAGEALIQGPITAETAEFAKEFAGRLNQPRFYTLALSLYILAGNLKSPQQAAEIPEFHRFLNVDLPSGLRELILTDDILLGILEKKADSATRISELIRSNRGPGDRLLGAEFYYDYGNPLRGAQLFSQLGDDYTGRTADALALAGEIQAARNLWTALANSPGADPEVYNNLFYNLAATATDEREAASWLEKIFTGAAGTEGKNLPYAVIRYSRLLNTFGSIAILEKQKLQDYPLLDLELLRRRMETLPLNQCTAEVWLLLGRNPETEELYRWAAWYFDRQKLYAETAQLLKIAARNGITAPWINVCLALSMMREGNSGEGYRVLEAEFKNQSADWRIPANMARFLESQRSPSAALSLYQEAADLAKNPLDLSQVQFRLYRCLQTLGRFEESIMALEYAAELDPDNLNVKMEISRLYRN